MKGLRIRLAVLLFVFAGLTCVPIGVNLAGHSLYLYIDLGKKDVIFGAAIGVSHNAISDSYDESEVFDAYMIDYAGTTYGVGPVELVIEPSEKFDPLRLDVLTEPDYLGFEFPWLLIPVALCVLGIARVIYIQKKMC